MTDKELYIFLKTKFIEAGGITEKEAAEIIGITQSTFNKRIKNGFPQIFRSVKNHGGPRL